MFTCYCSFSPSIRQFSSVGISTRSMLITSGPALAQALYDREQEGLASFQTLIYKTCSFWNWLWPLPHLQWTSALNCMGFLISPRRSLCSLINHVLFFSVILKCAQWHWHTYEHFLLTQMYTRIHRHTDDKALTALLCPHSHTQKLCVAI